MMLFVGRGRRAAEEWDKMFAVGDKKQKFSLSELKKYKEIEYLNKKTACL
jgi:hypothetical protein